jgi:PDZ domain/Aspartyl protease
MKIRFTLLPILILIIFGSSLMAQRGFFIPPGSKSVDIPFELNNNFIILQLVANGRLPLRFILDTGAGHTLLTKKEVGNFLDLKYDRSFQVMGSDLTKPVTAYLAKGVRFDLPNKISAPQEDILVLEEDFFHFEEYSGITIQGILSANIFSRYIMKINYDKNLITLYDRAFFDARDVKGYSGFPIQLFRDKPYFLTELTMSGDSVVPVKLLLDTGAAMPLLLFADTDPQLKPPPTAIPANIGFGLGGDLTGFTGRIKSLNIGEHKQQNIVTYFQVLDTIVDSLAANHRNGLVGNGLLNRFIVIFDYHDEKVWFKPSKRFKEAFVYDRSGISVILSGENMNTYIVQHVVPNSPASEMDIQKGDRILKLGYKPAILLSLSGIAHRLQGKPGKKVKLTIERNGNKMKKEIILRDLL